MDFMAYACATLDVMEFFVCVECWNPKAATLFLLEEMGAQGITPMHVLDELNYQRWELIPLDDLEEYTAEGCDVILQDVGLCGMALIAAC